MSDPFPRRVCALVTRPADDAESLFAQLRPRGIDVLHEPLLTIRFQGATVDLDGVQAILVTSANGARALAHAVDNPGPGKGSAREILGAAAALRALPLLAVGDASAGACRSLGFTTVDSAAGDVGDLARLVRARLKPDAGVLLHPAGGMVAGNLAELLAPAGFSVRKIQLYEADTAADLSIGAARALAQGQVQAALFYSPRTAATFAQLVRKAGIEKELCTVGAYCLSEAVGSTLADLPWRHVRVAVRPDQEALLAALDLDLASGTIVPAKGGDPEAVTVASPTAEHTGERAMTTRQTADTASSANGPGPGEPEDPGKVQAVDADADANAASVAAPASPPAEAPGPDAPAPETPAPKPPAPKPPAPKPPANEAPPARETAAGGSVLATGATNDGSAAEGDGKGAAGDGPAATGQEAVDAEMVPEGRGGGRGKLVAALVGLVVVGGVAGFAALPWWRDTVPEPYRSWLPSYPADDARLAAIAVAADAARKEAAAAVARLGDTARQVEGLTTRMDGLGKRVDGVATEVTTVTGKVTAIESAPPPSLAGVPLEGEVGKALAVVAGHLARLEAQAAEEAGRTERQLDALTKRAETAEARAAALSDRIEELARNQIGTATITALYDRISATDGRVAAADEGVRRLAGRQDAALAWVLAVAQLREAIHRGSPFVAELEATRVLAEDPAEVAAAVAAFAAFADRGLPTRAAIERQFDGLDTQMAHTAAAPEGEGWMERTAQQVLSVVTIRRIDGTAAGESTLAIMARASARMRAGDLAGAVGEMKALTGGAAKVAEPWVTVAAARAAADDGLSTLTARALARTAAKARAGG